MRNEGSGGSNVILVAVGSEVWELSFKVALHGSVMFHELQIFYKILTLFVGTGNGKRELCAQGGRGWVHPWIQNVSWESQGSESPKSLNFLAEVSFATKKSQR